MVIFETSILTNPSKSSEKLKITSAVRQPAARRLVVPGAVVWCARRWDKKNNKEINIEIIYTHVNIPSVLHASSQTPHHDRIDNRY